jgi:hypothetical protein
MRAKHTFSPRRSSALQRPHFLYLRVTVSVFLYVRRMDVVATANDQVLGAANNAQIAALIELAQDRHSGTSHRC